MNFLFNKEFWEIKCISVYTKILGSTTLFNIDNNQKCLLIVIEIVIMFHKLKKKFCIFDQINADLGEQIRLLSKTL